MLPVEAKQEISPIEQRSEALKQYWAGDLTRRVYLLRRQRKAILETCRRVAVLGASSNPDHSSFVAIEKLLGLGIEVIPVFSERESLLGLRCYRCLSEVPGNIDVVQVYPSEAIDLVEVAKQAVAKGVGCVWIEQGMASSEAVEQILSDGKVQLVEYENLLTEYIKHIPVALRCRSRKEKRAAKVKERMSKNPATVKPDDGLQDAIWKMEHGHFRHLPVIDADGRLIGMLSDRDIRLIQPSRLFVERQDAMVQLWSISVQQAAVFDPLTVAPETTLKEAAELMLRWHVGGLPVVDDHGAPVGMITYTDILREFVGREEN